MSEEKKDKLPEQTEKKITPEKLEESIGHLQEAVELKQGKTWLQWFVAMDKKKMASLLLVLAGLVSAAATIVNWEAISSWATSSSATNNSEVVTAINGLGTRLDTVNRNLASVQTGVTSLLSRPVAPVPTPPAPSDDPPSPPGPEPDAQRPIIAPAEVEANVGRQVVIRAKALGTITYIVPPNSPCDFLAHCDTLVITPTVARDFYVIALTSVENRVHYVTILVKLNNAPQPPPAPVDAFIQAVRTAYVTSGSNRASLDRLINLYRASSAIINNPSNTTTDSVRQVMHIAIQNAIQDDLRPVRQVIEQELGRTLGTSIRPLTPELRAQIIAEFSKVAGALEACR